MTTKYHGTLDLSGMTIINMHRAGLERRFDEAASGAGYETLEQLEDDCRQTAESYRAILDAMRQVSNDHSDGLDTYASRQLWCDALGLYESMADRARARADGSRDRGH